MEIFEWVKDVERIYEDLIEKAKNENLAELENLRTEQESIMEKKIVTFRELVGSALESLSKSLENENLFIKKKLKDFKKKMETSYNDNKENLIELIIKDIGFDF